MVLRLRTHNMNPSSIQLHGLYAAHAVSADATLPQQHVHSFPCQEGGVGGGGVNIINTTLLVAVCEQV